MALLEALRRLDEEDSRELDALLRVRVRLMTRLAPLIVVFNWLDWEFYPDFALRWLAYRTATVLLLVLVVQPLARRLSFASAFAEIICFTATTSLCFALMTFESGGFHSEYDLIAVLLCWAFSVVVPLDARRALMLGCVILGPYVAAGLLYGDTNAALLALRLPVVAGALLFTLLGSHLASSLYLRQRRAERETQRLVHLLEDTSRRDPLTGLRNRRAMYERIRGELGRLQRGHTPFCVLIADVDRFKTVNDRFGHPVGDLVLTRTCRSMEVALRAQDGLFRLGGEEFTVVLTGARLPDARQAAERLRRTIEALRVELPGGRWGVTISLGVAEAIPGDDVDSLLARADEALYRAKAAGRNRVACSEAAAPARSA